MAFSPKVIKVSIPKAPTVSTKGLTMKANSLKVGFNVAKQHIAKINWGKTDKITQKPSSQL